LASRLDKIVTVSIVMTSFKKNKHTSDKDWIVEVTDMIADYVNGIITSKMEEDNKGGTTPVLATHRTTGNNGHNHTTLAF
jgi:hypothetical protein